MAKSLPGDLKGLSLDENYSIAAAIDFGTTFSGYAFSFKNKPNDIKMNKNWGAELGCDSYKAPTCVMTNPDGSFNSFGYQAEDGYNQLESDETVIGGPNGYNLYRNFKMLLHSKGVNMHSTVVSTSGHIRKALDIFVMVLEFLKEHMMDPIKRALNFALNSSDVRWVLTVPAIWNDESKWFMREAAYRAGLISENNSTKLLIALEPEAASIFCRSLDLNSFASSDSTEALTFRSGEKILIIDAGGGTIDITAHEILIDGNVKEIMPPSGGPWGGIKVDQQFVILLEKTFGSDFINKFKVERPQQWLQLMTFFEKSKKAFKLDGKYSVKVSMPYSFGTDFTKHTKSDIEEIAKKSRDKGISVNNGFITVKHDRAKMLFSEPIDQIAKHVKKLLNEENLAGLNYLLLVGGFGECMMLQDACQSILPKGIKLLVPVEAQSAVIRGAVLFGHNPLNICSRIARFTYGVDIRKAFREGKHDPNKKVTDKDGEIRCKDIFDSLIVKGETVKTGETRDKIFFSSHNKTSTLLSIYQTDKLDVTYVDEPGVTKFGSAILYHATSDEIQMRVTIGHTELLFEAKERDGKDEFPVKITVDFLGD